MVLLFFLMRPILSCFYLPTLSLSLQHMDGKQLLLRRDINHLYTRLFLSLGFFNSFTSLLLSVYIYLPFSFPLLYLKGRRLLLQQRFTDWDCGAMPSQTTTQGAQRPVTVVGAMKETLRSVFSSGPAKSANGNTTSSPASRAGNITPFPSSTVPRTTIRRVHQSATQTTPANTPAPATTTTAPQPRQRSSRQAHPDALPAPNFYEQFPHAVGPLANVVVTSDEDYLMMLLIAQRITIVRNRWDRNEREGRLSEEDIAKGGFFVYAPKSDNPQYFKMLTAAAKVYGSSSYSKASGKKR